jgi:flavin-dependent dehydrogenase
VVVVGARVAGAATALHLARAGHDVLIVDRAGPPGDTTSTHAVMRSGVVQLRRAGVLDRIVAAGTPAIRRVDLVFDDERISFGVADELGVDAYYAPRRTVLDTALLDAAVAAGAEFRTGVSVTDVVRDRTGRVEGITARVGGRHLPIAARHVVGADGTGSRIARAVAARDLRRQLSTNAVLYGYHTGVDASGYDFRFVDRLNLGLIPTNDGQVLVFAGGPGATAPRDEAQLAAVLRRVAPDLAAGVGAGRRVGRLHRSRGVPNLLRVPTGPGWSLVGDAGFTKDPISARGITDAPRDAELAAAAIDASLGDRRTETEAGAHYRRVRDRFAVPILEHTMALAAFDWDGPEASRLMRGLGEAADAECRFLSERRVFAVAA